MFIHTKCGVAYEEQGFMQTAFVLR